MLWLSLVVAGPLVGDMARGGGDEGREAAAGAAPALVAALVAEGRLDETRLGGLVEFAEASSWLPTWAKLGAARWARMS